MSIETQEIKQIDINVIEVAVVLRAAQG